MYLIDSNILAYYLDGNDKAKQFLDNHWGSVAISTIAVIEVLSYNYTELQLQKIKKFLSVQFKWLEITHDILDKTAELRRQKKTKTPDAIIAASALLHGCVLVTRNQKDFNHLPISIVNPIDQ